jgi:hypothetical protein
MNILSRLPSPFSVEGAYLWFQVFSLLFLTATILTGAGTIITGFIANRRTANALAVQQERAAKAEKDLKELGNAVAPREFPLTADLQNALRPFPAIHVRVRSVNDAETVRLASQIAGALQGSGWIIDSVIHESPALDIRDGVVIGMNVGILPPEDNSTLAALALVKQLRLSKLSAMLFPTGPPLPLNTLQIDVGLRPSTYFLDPKLKELRKASEEREQRIEEELKKFAEANRSRSK